MPRLFTGLEIPSDIGFALSLKRGGLTGARWIEPENYHITLRFIGDVDNQTANEVMNNLDYLSESLRFPVRLTHLGTFGGDKPRALYAGVESSEPLSRLQAAHERMLRDFFPAAKVVTYSKQEWMYGDLRDGKLAAIFGDGMRLGFWLAGTDSGGCCLFSGGPYLAADYLGNGLAIATSPENPELVAAFDYALQQISTKGIFAELYLRYFPVGFF